MKAREHLDCRLSEKKSDEKTSQLVVRVTVSAISYT